MTKSELAKLAFDIYKGHVFTDRHLPPDSTHDLKMVFPILGLMDEKARNAFIESDPGMVYEYFSAAGPVCVNGYPMFFSLRYISKAETTIVLDKVQELEEMEKRALESIPEDSDE